MLGQSDTRKTWVGFLVCTAVLCGVPGATAAAGPEDGRALFAGERPFRSGGPACASCHAVAGLGFPGGGTLGPDLTTAFQDLGPEGMSAALQTLYFPTMSAIFAGRPLAPDEQTALAAFFRGASEHPRPGAATRWIVLVSLGGLALAVVATALRGRGRLGGVRAALVESSRGGRPR